MITELKLHKLTKQQLHHLLSDVVGIKELNELWQRCRQGQTEHDLKCWDCEGIAKDLERLQQALGDE